MYGLWSHHSLSPSDIYCPNCQSQWREALYPYEEIARIFPQKIAKRKFDLWRYSELLPIHNPIPTLKMGEGGTPLIRAVNLG